MTKDDKLVKQLKIDYRQAGLSDRQKALCEFAHKPTLRPAQMTKTDMDPLRVAGLADKDILDAVQVTSYFNYINRVADALGVDPEPWMQGVLEKDQEPAE
ncbi:MAG: peroxidase-related enzyme [Acidobacteria bacterium]|nr:peroxidase-related enzyme [Acidobacteriota bacterium]